MLVYWYLIELCHASRKTLAQASRTEEGGIMLRLYSTNIKAKHFLVHSVSDQHVHSGTGEFAKPFKVSLRTRMRKRVLDISESDAHFGRSKVPGSTELELHEELARSYTLDAHRRREQNAIITQVFFFYTSEIRSTVQRYGRQHVNSCKLIQNMSPVQ